jgi:hypothetical protein
MIHLKVETEQMAKAHSDFMYFIKNSMEKPLGDFLGKQKAIREAVFALL